MAKKVFISFDFDNDNLYSYFGCTEIIEGLFSFEFSCGDGLFYSDLEEENNIYKSA